MTRITLDDAACEQLTNASGSAQICDRSGQTVGYFVLGDIKPGQLPDGFQIPLSIEETEKLRGNRTGRTLDEILQGMGLQ